MKNSDFKVPIFFDKNGEVLHYQPQHVVNGGVGFGVALNEKQHKINEKSFKETTKLIMEIAFKVHIKDADFGEIKSKGLAEYFRIRCMSGLAVEVIKNPDVNSDRRLKINIHHDEKLEQASEIDKILNILGPNSKILIHLLYG